MDADKITPEIVNYGLTMWDEGFKKALDVITEKYKDTAPLISADAARMKTTAKMTLRKI